MKREEKLKIFEEGARWWRERIREKVREMEMKRHETNSSLSYF